MFPVNPFESSSSYVPSHSPSAERPEAANAGTPIPFQYDDYSLALITGNPRRSETPSSSHGLLSLRDVESILLEDDTPPAALDRSQEQTWPHIEQIPLTSADTKLTLHCNEQGRFLISGRDEFGRKIEITLTKPSANLFQSLMASPGQMVDSCVVLPHTTVAQKRDIFRELANALERFGAYTLRSSHEPKNEYFLVMNDLKPVLQFNGYMMSSRRIIGPTRINTVIEHFIDPYEYHFIKLLLENGSAGISTTELHSIFPTLNLGSTLGNLRNKLRDMLFGIESIPISGGSVRRKGRVTKTYKIVW